MRAVAGCVIALTLASQRMNGDVHIVPRRCLWMLWPDFVGPCRYGSKGGHVFDGKEITNLPCALRLEILLSYLTNDPVSLVSSCQDPYRKSNWSQKYE
jgi:hypothetical protein